MTAPWLDARTGDPKGFAPYKPTAPWKHGVVVDVLDLFAELEADDALPIGPRTAGYALSMRETPSGLRYAKVVGGNVNVEHRDGLVSFKPIEDAIKRLRQADELPWEFVSDGSAVSYPVSDHRDARAFAERVLDPDHYDHDLRDGQQWDIRVRGAVEEPVPPKPELMLLAVRQADVLSEREKRQEMQVERPRRGLSSCGVDQRSGQAIGVRGPIMSHGLRPGRPRCAGDPRLLVRSE